ncbi:MAG: cell division/cell wall cluster transcriptional repressor MraZ [Chloroflexi bacterium]|nr:cell division/cell wall cluster transcriptional repressor MraZ [Chloroflexota bacterium]
MSGMWFLGEHKTPLTRGKEGGLTLPARWREALAGGCVVTLGLERCLLVFPVPAWEGWVSRLQAGLPLTQSEGRRLLRHWLGGAHEALPDALGRVALSDRQIAYASLKEHAVVVGVGTHLEVWNDDAWLQQLADLEKRAASDAEAVTQYLG